MIDKIMNYDCIKENPPVLVDIGASGGINDFWRPIAKYSICIAFDADDRDLRVSSDEGREFRKFYLFNKIVSDKKGQIDFYLTKSPHCSSTLKPDLEKLANYSIKSFFEIEKILQLETITIKDAIDKIGYNYIDWFKTDSQGTDLRIFTSLPNELISKVLVAEFEPGIMDAYLCEDKLYKIMEFFEGKDFWCDSCTIKGMQRIKEKFKIEYFNFFERKFFHLFLKNIGFWAEISYMNEMKNPNFEKRDYLLMCCFAFLKKQYGFAIEIAEKGKNYFGDKIFDEITKFSIRKMKIQGYPKIPFYILNEIYKKILKYV